MLKNFNIWVISSLFVSIGVLIPIITVFFSFFEETSNYYQILKDTFLFEYIFNSFTLLISVLFLTFLLGWLSRWFLQRLNMVSEKDLKDLNKISAALLEAEKGNEKARNRELELNKKISQLEAELEAAMDGLRAARLETEELESSLVEKKL